MSIEEIKDIKKLQQMLKSELELRKYTYECCIEAGKELAKHSFEWDGKEKNLVIQAMELNERYEKLKQTITDIKEIVGLGLVDGLQSEEYSGFLKILQAQILQKISEVE